MTIRINRRRRKIVQTSLLSGGVARWITPVIVSASLPAHAQTSEITTTTTQMPQCVNDVMVSDQLAEDIITWNKQMSVAQYNGPGTLSQVIIRVKARARAEVTVENQDQTAKSSTSELRVDIVVTNPDASTTTASIVDNRQVDLNAFDGMLDFAGDSSAAFEQQTNETVETRVLTDVDSFIGTGTIAFPTMASGDVVLTGSAAFAATVTAYAEASVEVEYVCV